MLLSGLLAGTKITLIINIHSRRRQWTGSLCLREKGFHHLESLQSLTVEAPLGVNRDVYPADPFRSSGPPQRRFHTPARRREASCN